MGELILCRRPIAATPFYIEEASLNVYSLEELCYYIKHNVYLLNQQFMSRDLCHWIGRELEMQELEGQLLDFMKENVPLHIFVGHILVASGYLTGQEIKETLALISSFENKSEEECKKLRGDRLMNQNKLVDAIYEYEDLIDGSNTAEISPELLGDVWHNLGTAYARLFFFSEAAACFEKGYRNNRRQSSLLSLLYALRCGRLEEAFDKTVDRYQIPSDMVERVKAEVTELSRQEAIVEFDRRIDEIAAQGEQTQEWRQPYREIVDGWKKEYGVLCRI